MYVPLAGAEGGRQRAGGDWKVFESDDKEVTVVGCTGLSLTLPTAPSLGVSLLSHGGIGGWKREGANLKASLNDSSYVTWSSSSMCVSVCVCASVCVHPACSRYPGSASEVRAPTWALGKLSSDQAPLGNPGILLTRRVE